VHINTVFFCFSNDLHLYFLSHPESVHCHNLIRRPQMAMAVVDSHQLWGEPHRGLQLFGTGSLTSGRVADQARELYAARFPRSANVLGRVPDEPTPSGFRGLRFYRFIPERAQILDEWEFGEEVFITATILPNTARSSSPRHPGLLEGG
jgi:hypothetical protein